MSLAFQQAIELLFQRGILISLTQTFSRFRLHPPMRAVDANTDWTSFCRLSLADLFLFGRRYYARILAEIGSDDEILARTKLVQIFGRDSP